MPGSYFLGRVVAPNLNTTQRNNVRNVVAQTMSNIFSALAGLNVETACIQLPAVSMKSGHGDAVPRFIKEVVFETFRGVNLAPNVKHLCVVLPAHLSGDVSLAWQSAITSLLGQSKKKVLNSLGNKYYGPLYEKTTELPNFQVSPTPNSELGR